MSPLESLTDERLLFAEILDAVLDEAANAVPGTGHGRFASKR